jgi:hypothetical protein
VPEKNRSAGITVIAVLALVGSALLLAMAVLIAISMIAMPIPASNDAKIPPMFFKVFRVVIPFMYALPAVWGIISAVGLLQLRNWARISTIIFSVVLIVFGAFGILTSMVFFLKPPPGNGLDPKIFSLIGVFTALFALAQIGVGIWWLVFFNRASVKAQFLPQPPSFPHLGHVSAPYAIDMPHSATPPPPGSAPPTGLAPPPSPPIAAPNPPGRPLSISIIGWFMLVSCLFVPFNILFHTPVMVFATILTGLPAVIFVLIVAALNVYIGIALLRMKPAGRLVGMGYFLFGLLNVAVICFAPGRSARLARFLDMQQSMFPWMRSAQANSLFRADITPFLIVGAVGGAVFSLVLLYFLAAAKPAFDKAARARVG